MPVVTRTTPATSSVPLGNWRRRVVLLTLCGAAFSISQDTATQSIAVVSLLHQLGHRPDLPISVWIPAMHVVAYIALLLVGGALADRFGAKRVLVTACVGYLAAAALMVSFPHMPAALLAGRAVRGACSAAILPSALSLLVLVCGSGRARTRAAITWAGFSAAGPLVTPLISAAAIGHVWWPRIIGAMSVLDVLIAVTAVVAIPSVPADHDLRVNWRWLATMTIAGGLLALALHKAPDWHWHSSTFLLVCGAGVVVMVIAFVATPDGLAQLGMVRAVPRVRYVMVTLGTAVLALFGMLLLVIQYFQVLGGPNPLPTAVALVTASCVATMLGSVIGMWLHRQHCVVAAAIIGSVLMLDGLAIGLTAGMSSGIAPLLGMVSVTSLGFALVMGITLETLCASLPATRTGMPWATQLVLVQLSGLLGTALVGVLANQGYRDSFIVPADLRAGASADIGRIPIGDGVRATTAIADEGGSPLVIAMRNAFIMGYRDGLLALIAAVGIAVIALVVVAALARKSNTPHK